MIPYGYMALVDHPCPPAPAKPRPVVPGVGFRARARCLCGHHGFAHLPLDDRAPPLDPCTTCRSCGYYQAAS